MINRGDPTTPIDPRLMRRVATALFLGGAGIAVAGVVLPTDPIGDQRGLLLSGALAAVLGFGIMLGTRRMSPPSLHLLLIMATGLVTSSLILSGQLSGSGALNVEMLYLCPALIAGYFLTRRGAMAQLALIGTGYALVLKVAPPVAAGSTVGGTPGRWFLTVGTLTITALVVSGLRERSMRELFERGQTASLLEATLEATADGIAVIRDGHMIRANKKLLDMFGIPPDALETGQGDAALRLALAQVRDSGSLRERLRRLSAYIDGAKLDEVELMDGRIFERHTQPQYAGGTVIGTVISFRDVTQRRRAESQLRHLADHDPLTGLFSRHRFEQELEREIRFSDGRHGGGALLLMDLDNFKYVNDTLGHRAGDEVILAVTRVIKGSARRTDVISRLSGDEFAILLPRTSPVEATRWAERLVRNVRDNALVVGNQRIRLTASIGMVVFDGTEHQASALMIGVDRAMYKAKHEGRNRIAIHDEDLAAAGEGEAHLTWNQQIREAIEQERLVAYAQPIMDLATQSIVRHELLIRIRANDGSMIPPGAFLNHAERYGQIQEIDRWIRRQAMDLIAAEANRGRRLSLSVNVSTHSIAERGLAAEIQGDLTRMGIDPACLTFEMTETAAIANMDTAREFAEEVRELGCTFALDDFGSGFASFYYLKHFPVDIIKIDGDFIRDIDTSIVDQLVVDAIVEIAQRLGMQTIAEFAENDSVIEALVRRDVDMAQGYGVGRPIPADDLWPREEPAANFAGGTPDIETIAPEAVGTI